MEDAHVHELKLDKPGVYALNLIIAHPLNASTLGFCKAGRSALFAVFDGHGGKEVSTFAAVRHCCFRNKTKITLFPVRCIYRSIYAIVCVVIVLSKTNALAR